jgi:hypothetical protein
MSLFSPLHPSLLPLYTTMAKTPTEVRRMIEENESVHRCFRTVDLEQIWVQADAEWHESSSHEIKTRQMNALEVRLSEVKSHPALVPRHQLRAEDAHEKRVRESIRIIGGQQLSAPIVLDRNGLMVDNVAARSVYELVVLDVADLVFAERYLPNVSIVYFHDAFDTPLEDELVALGEALKEVHFGELFNQSITRTTWPARLQALVFGWNFDQPVEVELHGLPANLYRLTFGFGFNQRVEKLVLPARLQLLSFQEHFVQPVKHLVLPETLEGLSLVADRWAHSAALPRLPASLVMLQLGNRMFQDAEQIEQVRLGLHRNPPAATAADECTVM